MKSNEEVELCRRAIAIGEELVRIADAIGQPLAAAHIDTGLAILRTHTQLAEALSRFRDTPAEPDWPLE